MLKENALNNIPADNITVVIQGLLYRDHVDGDLAARAIQSIQQHLPRAEIVISTWRHQSVTGLLADHIVFSDEPVCYIDKNGEANNVLRQIVSTRRGIEAATRAYVLKFRADHVLLNANIARLRRYTDETAPRLFSQPVTTTNLFVRNPVYMPMLFHLSDLVQFGDKQDLLDVWSIDLPQFQDLYFTDKPSWHIWGYFGGHTLLKQVPEQTIFLSWLKKRGFAVNLPHIFYTNYSYFKLWEQLVTDHFFVMDWENSGITFPKRFHHVYYSKKANYTETELRLVRKQLSRKWYRLRYCHLLANKYIFCWFKIAFLRKLISISLFSLSPSFANYIRRMYHGFKKK